jgi:hypothetical protein
MVNVPKRLKTHINSPYDRNDIIGFLILYIIFVFIIPYLLFHHASFKLFVTYFANVDIIANILAVNYPDYFIKWYSFFNVSLRGYLSFNIISIVALSGIFYFGIKDIKRSPYERLAIMIIMSIVTWTLPTLGIPYINNKIEEFLQKININENQYDIYRGIITISISFLFLLLEWVLISYTKKLKL